MTKTLDGATTSFSFCCTRVFSALRSMGGPICRGRVRLGRRRASYDVMLYARRRTLPSCCAWLAEASIGYFIVVHVPIVPGREQAVSSQSYPTDLHVESVALR